MKDQTPARDSFKTREAKYLFYNFHLPANREKMRSFLTSDGHAAPNLGVFVGEPGIDRNYMINATIYEIQQKRPGFNMAAVLIDLNGFEEGRGSLRRYADFRF